MTPEAWSDWFALNEKMWAFNAISLMAGVYGGDKWEVPLGVLAFALWAAA